MKNGLGNYLSSAFVDVVNRNDIVPNAPILLLRDVRHFAFFHGHDRDLQLSSIADRKRVEETWFSEQCSLSVCTFIGAAKTRCQRATNTCATVLIAFTLEYALAYKQLWRMPGNG
jgi:hypothetical protein